MGQRWQSLAVRGMVSQRMDRIGTLATFTAETRDNYRSIGVDRGVWYQVKEGIKCVVVQNHVYMLTEPATHYYRIMTRSNRMPILIGQTI